LTSAYYEFLPKWSNPSADMNPKYIEVITFHIRYGKGDDFRSAVAKVHEANQKLKVPYHYGWYRLFNGGPGGTYVLTEDHANWASFEDDPAVKPMRDRLREAFGEQEAMSVVERLNAAIEGTYSAIVRTRPDLSYVPAK
jgi:acetylornithine deacetylase/succinyl-diaminopimelate desuccinylase-like protein